MARTITIGIDQGEYSFIDDTKVIILSKIDFTPSQINLAYVVNLTQKVTYYAPAEDYVKCDVSGLTITITDPSKANLVTGDILHIQFFYPEDAENPSYTQDIDANHRSSLNTVFGEKITGRRIPSAAAQFQYGFQTGEATVTVVNGGDVSVTDSLLNISSGINIAGAAIIQSTEYLRYVPGYEAYMVFTNVFTQGKIDSYQRAGLFDDANGFFIGYEGEDFCISRRRDSVDTKTIIDVSKVFTDGSFDTTKGNVYKISFGYLGFATINYEVLTPDGNWVSIGKFKYPNSEIVTHITQTNLPSRGEVANTGNNTDISISTGSFSFGIVDGGGADPSARFFSSSVPTVSINAGNFHVATFRNKTIFNSIKNRIKAVLTLISTATDLSKNSSWKLLRNATITNTPTWTDVNANDSVMEYSTDATIDFNTGDDLIPWIMAKNDSYFEQIEEQFITLKPGQTSSIILTTPLGTSGTVETAFRWKELF